MLGGTTALRETTHELPRYATLLLSGWLSCRCADQKQRSGQLCSRQLDSDRHAGRLELEWRGRVRISPLSRDKCDDQGRPSDRLGCGGSIDWSRNQQSASRRQHAAARVWRRQDRRSRSVSAAVVDNLWFGDHDRNQHAGRPIDCQRQDGADLLSRLLESTRARRHADACQHDVSIDLDGCQLERLA